MDVTVKTRTLYKELGEEAGVRTLVEAFYDVIEQDPGAHELHLLHLRGHGVAHSREEQFNYLSGFFGGPSRYVQKHGHSRLTEIHEHVPIGPAMRDLWLRCMEKAMAVLLEVAGAMIDCRGWPNSASSFWYSVFSMFLF